MELQNVYESSTAWPIYLGYPPPLLQFIYDCSHDARRSIPGCQSPLQSYSARARNQWIEEIQICDEKRKENTTSGNGGKAYPFVATVVLRLGQSIASKSSLDLPLL